MVYLLEDGAGRLVEPKNPKALADEMLNALTTPKEQYTNQEACDEDFCIFMMQMNINQTGHYGLYMNLRLERSVLAYE